MTTRSHWEGIYEKTDPTEVGWYQSDPETSRRLIKSAGAAKECGIIDVGGGASLLVDKLIDDGFTDLTVLDISAAALEHARSRLADRSRLVTWMEEDVTRFSPDRSYDLWHDRAVFHFLTKPSERDKYVSVLKRALAAGGHLVIGTFAMDGPPKCSGLDVARYSAESLGETLGPTFTLARSTGESHFTPSGKEQRYLFCVFEHRSDTVGP
jgi:SAM-dependent methyltransferase